MTELSENVISFENVKFSYSGSDGVYAVNGVNLEVGRGEFLSVIGHNGSGKSTLLSILAGVRRADGGSFLYRGTDLLRRPALIPKVLGYVPQGDPLMEELNAWDNLRMWYDRETLKRELADGALKLLGIDGFLKTPVRKMSGGMKKASFYRLCGAFPIPGFWCWTSPRRRLTPSARRISAGFWIFTERMAASC